MADLTTRAAVKTYLGITVTTWDAILDVLVTQASKAIERYCYRVFAAASYTEYYNGNNNQRLCLRQYPVNSITSIHDDTDREFAAVDLIATTDYTFDTNSGIVYFDGVTLTKGLRNIKVVYNAGYSTIPEDLVLACYKLIGGAFNKRKSDGQASDALGNVSFSYETIFSPEVEMLLRPFVKWAETDV